VSTFAPKVEGFWPEDAANYEAPEPDSTQKDSIQSDMLVNAKQNCIELGLRMGEIMEVSNKLIVIKKQINNGAINLATAKNKLDWMLTVLSANSKSKTDSLSTLLTSELAPSRSIEVDITDKNKVVTVRSINNMINNEYEKISELFRSIQTMSHALRCDKLI
jgi:hypothetical protein